MADCFSADSNKNRAYVSSLPRLLIILTEKGDAQDLSRGEKSTRVHLVVTGLIVVAEAMYLCK